MRGENQIGKNKLRPRVLQIRVSRETSVKWINCRVKEQCVGGHPLSHLLSQASLTAAMYTKYTTVCPVSPCPDAGRVGGGGPGGMLALVVYCSVT